MRKWCFVHLDSQLAFWLRALERRNSLKVKKRELVRLLEDRQYVLAVQEEWKW
jgi:hypothetical protein